MKKTANIIKSFDLQVMELEPNVLKVINSDKEVNIHKLGTDLGTCVLLVKNIRVEKVQGYGHTFGNVAYIKLGNGTNDRVYSLWHELQRKGVSTVIDVYDSSVFLSESVDTVYSKEEICKIVYN